MKDKQQSFWAPPHKKCKYSSNKSNVAAFCKTRKINGIMTDSAQLPGDVSRCQRPGGTNTKTNTSWGRYINRQRTNSLCSFLLADMIAYNCVRWGGVESAGYVYAKGLFFASSHFMVVYILYFREYCFYIWCIFYRYMKNFNDQWFLLRE